MTPPTSAALTGIDTHAHIFERDLPLAAGRRYSPEYDARVEQYLAHLDRFGLSHGVLVQPSFLGTDNRYMVEALSRHPTRLRGTAVVESDIDGAALDTLEEAGVVGIRLNLIGKSPQAYLSVQWQALFAELGRRGWSVEVQRGIDDIAQVVRPILASGVAVVVDHFGLPSGELDPARKGDRALLELAASEDLWVKLSAPYRSKAGLAQAQASLSRLREAFGHSERLVWGSDWPHTRFEAQTDYAAQVAFMEALLPQAEERQRVLCDNPARLFKIERSA